MAMDMKQFKENMLVYGADVRKWPEEIRQAGLETLGNSSEFQELLVEQEHFERLLKTRKYEETSTDLPERIIEASLRHKRKAPFSIGAFLSELLGEFSLPKPVFAAVSVLMICVFMIGFTIGFSNPMKPALAEQEQTALHEFLYNGGEVL